LKGLPSGVPKAREPTDLEEGTPVKKHTAKTLKMTLHRETLRALEAQELGAVAGGATNRRTVCGSCNTCIVLHTMCFP
jgi:hypothetical protein